MRRISFVLLLALFCGACAKAPQGKPAVLDRALLVELTLRMEVKKLSPEQKSGISAKDQDSLREAKGNVEDTKRISFPLAKGTTIAKNFKLGAANQGPTIEFTNLRIEGNSVLFDKWSFRDIPELKSKGGAKIKVDKEEELQANPHSLPLDGTKKLEGLLGSMGTDEPDGSIALAQAHYSLIIRLKEEEGKEKAADGGR